MCIRDRVRMEYKLYPRPTYLEILHVYDITLSNYMYERRLEEF